MGQALALISSISPWSAFSPPVALGGDPARPTAPSSNGGAAPSSGLAAAVTALLSHKQSGETTTRDQKQHVPHLGVSDTGPLRRASLEAGNLQGVEPRIHTVSSPISTPLVGRSVHTCSRLDTFRAVVERLAMPGVRRLVVVNPETGCVEGVVSLSDVAGYLC